MHTPYRISTITAVGSVGTSVDLDVLYEHLKLSPTRFAQISYGGGRHNVSTSFQDENNITEERKTRGCLPDAFKSQKSKTRQKKQQFSTSRDKNKDEDCRSTSSASTTVSTSSSVRHFDNQATVIAVMPSFMNPPTQYSLSHPLPMNSTNSLNMKVFRNGNVQITGIKYVEQGELAIQMLVEDIREIQHMLDTHQEESELQQPHSCLPVERGPARKRLVNDPHELRSINYRICLINSDYKTGFQVRREALYDILVSNYGVMCCYEPCIYPGVKIQFCWNDDMPRSAPGAARDGVCRCTQRCTRKGKGSGDGDCRRITIAVFRSGCIIITGAHTYTQLNDAYAYVRGILETHKDQILHVPRNQQRQGCSNPGDIGEKEIK